MVKIFCLHREAERGDSCRVCESYRIFVRLEDPIQTCRLFSQKLRAQEAAQAEAEDREDLEIAAEMAGTPHQTGQAAVRETECLLLCGVL